MLIFKKNNYWFTLIEIVVSLSILSIIMVSVLFIFINATNLSAKSEINRVMQENIKNVIETLSEDIRKNWISWVAKSVPDNCNFTFATGEKFKKWTKLCTNNNVYFLAKMVWWSPVRIDDLSKCSKLKDYCFIVKNWNNLTNSSVSVKELNFYLTNDYIPKLTISMIIQPSAKKWVKSKLIEESKIVVQTTISERSILKKYN